MTKRFTRSLHSKTDTWCTGEDSNLRSSQGAADLQSAAINHSATCAECLSFGCLLLASGDFHRGSRTRAEKTCRHYATKKIKNGAGLTTHKKCCPESLIECVANLSRPTRAAALNTLLSGISFLELATGAGEGI